MTKIMEITPFQLEILYNAVMEQGMADDPDDFVYGQIVPDPQLDPPDRLKMFFDGMRDTENLVSMGLFVDVTVQRRDKIIGDKMQISRNFKLYAPTKLAAEMFRVLATNIVH